MTGRGLRSIQPLRLTHDHALRIDREIFVILRRHVAAEIFLHVVDFVLAAADVLRDGRAVEVHDRARVRLVVPRLDARRLASGRWRRRVSFDRENESSFVQFGSDLSRIRQRSASDRLDRRRTLRIEGPAAVVGARPLAWQVVVRARLEPGDTRCSSPFVYR